MVSLIQKHAPLVAVVSAIFSASATTPFGVAQSTWGLVAVAAVVASIVLPFIKNGEAPKP